MSNVWSKWRYTASIRFAIDDQRTLGRVVHLAWIANVAVRAEVDWECVDSLHDDPSCVRYELRFPRAMTDFEQIELFGGLVAQELERLGVPVPDEPTHPV